MVWSRRDWIVQVRGQKGGWLMSRDGAAASQHYGAVSRGEVRSLTLKPPLIMSQALLKGMRMVRMAHRHQCLSSKGRFSLFSRPPDPLRLLLTQLLLPPQARAPHQLRQAAPQPSPPPHHQRPPVLPPGELPHRPLCRGYPGRPLLGPVSPSKGRSRGNGVEMRQRRMRTRNQ